MKKQLLTLGLLAMGTLTFGQFSFTQTSISFSGNTVPAGTSQGQFYSFQPNNGENPVYSDKCVTENTDLGGFDPNVYGTDDGITFFGGAIASVYFGEPCVAHDPSFGFNTGKNGDNGGIGAGVNVDLSAAANQKIKFTYVSLDDDNDRSDMTVTLQLFDAVYNPKLDNGTTVTLISDGEAHTVTLDFSGDIKSGAVLTDVRQVSFVYTSTTPSSDFGISLTDIKVGSAVTTGINAAQNLISETKLFPNPATESATVKLDLVSNSNVKVVLNDLVGKQMKVLAEGNYANVEQSFSVSDLAKGMYTVTYFVNGAAAKTQSLVVR